MSNIEQTSSLKTKISDNVAWIMIDRPARKNAMTQAMWTLMAQLLHELGSQPDVRAIVLSGAGGDFCAGADIGEFETVRGDAVSARRYESTNSAAFAALRECRVPTIAAISGICFGGGFGMAAACDLRIATANATFSVPAAKLGLAYPVDAMSDIVHALGAQMAKYLAYSADRLDAAAAKDAGFVLEIVEPESLDARVKTIAATIAGNAPLSVQASKASIRAVLSGSVSDADKASALGDATFESADYAEGRAAFRERRPARFTGS